jgi:GT2 family glycosyltransferase
MHKVAVVILNYKVADLVLKCVDSVKNSSYQEKLIIVVDNNSNDHLADKLQLSKELIFIQSKENSGYTGGNNLGIKEALKQKADYILVLNPDTEVEKDTIKILVEKAEKLEVGILCPKIYFSDSKTIWFAGGIMDYANVLGSNRGVDEEDTGQFDKDEEMDLVTGACMLVRAEVFEKIGLFDENYFLYYEDTDFCFRAKKAGFKIMYIHNAIVYHKNAQTTKLGSPLQDYFITRNRMLFASKFLSFRTKFALVREAFRNIKIAARRRALVDYLSGSFGKGSFKLP